MQTLTVEARTEGAQVVADLMLRNPKTLSVDAPVSEVRAILENPSVQMVLLTDGQRFAGRDHRRPCRCATRAAGGRLRGCGFRHDRPRRTCLDCLCPNGRQSAPQARRRGRRLEASRPAVPGRVPHPVLRSHRGLDVRPLGPAMGLFRVRGGPHEGVEPAEWPDVVAVAEHVGARSISHDSVENAHGFVIDAPTTPHAFGVARELFNPSTAATGGPKSRRSRISTSARPRGRLAGRRLARVRRQFLDRPAVAVGVLEEDELAPGELLDVARPRRRARPARRARRRMSGTTSCRPLTEPGGVSTIPVPIAIEHAEPGGVSCTKRSSSLTWWSWSALKPTLST